MIYTRPRPVSSELSPIGSPRASPRRWSMSGTRSSQAGGGLLLQKPPDLPARVVSIAIHEIALNLHLIIAGSLRQSVAVTLVSFVTHSGRRRFRCAGDNAVVESVPGEFRSRA